MNKLIVPSKIESNAELFCQPAPSRKRTAQHRKISNWSPSTECRCGCDRWAGRKRSNFYDNPPRNLSKGPLGISAQNGRERRYRDNRIRKVFLIQSNIFWKGIPGLTSPRYATLPQFLVKMLWRNPDECKLVCFPMNNTYWVCRVSFAAFRCYHRSMVSPLAGADQDVKRACFGFKWKLKPAKLVNANAQKNFRTIPSKPLFCCNIHLPISRHVIHAHAHLQSNHACWYVESWMRLKLFLTLLV